MGTQATYKQAGVNIDTANRFVAEIAKLTKLTRRNGSMGSLGGFSGFFKVPPHVKNPLIVAATDGVGTKLLVANAQNKYDSIGIDLVAMCVNDLITCGAEPLLFLDYFATGKLNKKKAVSLIKGIVKGCKQANSELIGGETAEMPGLYKKDDYDLAGFSVGIVNQKKIIDGKKVKIGNRVIGLLSSGLHSNGYSLARKVFSQNELKSAWGKKLLTPTKIYVKPILKLTKANIVKAVAHITGGGFYENIPRALPKNKDVIIKKGSWKVPPLFKEIQSRGNISEKEMFRTFNMGVGMTVIVSKNHEKKVLNLLKKEGVSARTIGTIVKGTGKVLLK
ncbi:phosphoribosylformylglycinamidine cyclo-ligase [Candidatus Omnitrophota bacterium]